MTDHIGIILPAPPRPPREYTPEYGNQLYRWMESLARHTQSVYYLRGSGLYLSPDSLPTSGYGLKPGEVFANAGILTVVREDDIWLGSQSATGSVGTLTVTT